MLGSLFYIGVIDSESAHLLRTIRLIQNTEKDNKCLVSQDYSFRHPKAANRRLVNNSVPA